MSKMKKTIEEELRNMNATAPDTSALLDRALTEDLVDVAYATVDSPVGKLLAASTPKGLVTLAYTEGRTEDVLERLSDRVSPRIMEAPERIDSVRRQLDEYFDGDRVDFDLDIDWSLSSGFARKILRATARIPYGKLLTYRDIARKAGNERASRAAGNALGSNMIPIIVPCHRVIRTGGGLGGYTGGLSKKEFLLRLEGALEV